MTVADLITQAGDPAHVRGIAMTGGPADVTFSFGEQIRGVRVDGPGPEYELTGEPGLVEIEVVGEPVQFGVRISQVGVTWLPFEV